MKKEINKNYLSLVKCKRMCCKPKINPANTQLVYLTVTTVNKFPPNEKQKNYTSTRTITYYIYDVLWYTQNNSHAFLQ